MGIPFLPIQSGLGGDIGKCNRSQVITCPFTKRDIFLVPAAHPDVGIIHVQEADLFGNCRIKGQTFTCPEMAMASKNVIITCEKLVEHGLITQDPARTSIPFFAVDAVVELPFGSYPSVCHDIHYYDKIHLEHFKFIPVFEGGAVGPTLNRILPLSVGDSRTTSNASFLQGLNAAFELTQRGFIDIGFIGGAEIDPFGNLNSTMIGSFPDDYMKPTVRLPGSGGAGDMSCSCTHTILMVQHEPRRFVKKLQYTTSLGHLDGSPDARKKAGLQGKGPKRVITTKALMGFDETTKRMKILATMPGETVQSVQEATGFELLVDENVYQFEPPTLEEIRLIREVIDPQQIFCKR